jgi:hypothetical protein
MTDQHRQDDVSPLTAAERDALDAFEPAGPGDVLRQRIVAALRDDGLLGARSPRRVRPAVRWWVAAAAAAVAVFLGGFSLGLSRGSPRATDALLVPPQQQQQVTAAWLQQMGSAYVGALARLAARPVDDATTGDVAQREAVARAAVIGAVAELVKLDPQDANLALALALLDSERARPGAVVRTVSF